MGRLVALLRTMLPDRALGDDLEPSLAAALASWPDVELAPQVFARAIADRLEPTQDVTSLCIADLALACACAEGAPAALAAFEAHCAPVIERAIAASRVPQADRADIGQIVRRRLLTATEGERPRIATYSARGSLKAWVRVTATREAARLLSRAGREVPAEDDEIEGMLARDDDPELAYLKRLYRAELKNAFAAAVEALEPRERLVLRQHMIDGLGIDQLAALHRVHRSTAARWIESARAAVMAATQRVLLQELRISRTELASIVRLIASQLDLSLPRLLR